jgi:hypothetical protein
MGCGENHERNNQSKKYERWQKPASESENNAENIANGGE